MTDINVTYPTTIPALVPLIEDAVDAAISEAAGLSAREIGYAERTSNIAKGSYTGSAFVSISDNADGTVNNLADITVPVQPEPFWLEAYIPAFANSIVSTRNRIAIYDVVGTTPTNLIAQADIGAAAAAEITGGILRVRLPASTPQTTYRVGVMSAGNGGTLTIYGGDSGIARYKPYLAAYRR